MNEENKECCQGSETSCDGSQKAPETVNQCCTPNSGESASGSLSEPLTASEQVKATDPCEKGQDPNDCKLQESDCCRTRNPANENS